MGERTILASFYSHGEAAKAAAEIHNQGIEVAEVDELDGYSNNAQPRDAYTISGKIDSLSALTLGAEPSSRDVGILLSADPAASGMAGEPDRMIGRNYLLTVVCDNKLVDTAVDIIKRYNGYT